MATWLPKANKRPEGSEVAYVDEPHTIGAIDANVVYLREVPHTGYPFVVTSTDGATTYTRVDGDPLPGQYRVIWSGDRAGSVVFNSADNAKAVLIDYHGRGSPLFARDINRLQDLKRDTDVAIDWSELVNIDPNLARTDGANVFKGAITVAGPAVTTDGGVSSSQTVAFRGFYDSDATTGVVSTKRDMVLQNIVSSGTAYRLALLNDAGTEVFSVNDSGVVTPAGALRGAGGSQAAPAYSFTNDADTGLFSAAAGILGVSIDGTQSVWFTTNTLRLFGGTGSTRAFQFFNSNADTGAGAVVASIESDGDGVSDNYGTLIFKTRQSGSAVARMKINAAGNIGFGTTNVQAWGSNFVALQVGLEGAIYAHKVDVQNSILIGWNHYFDGTNYVYRRADRAGLYANGNGHHIFYTAPSGTAGGAISWATSLFIHNSGNIGVGTNDIEAWDSNIRALEGPLSTVYYRTDRGQVRIIANNYASAGFKYKRTGGAAQVVVDENSIGFYIAPSGTIDTAITWTTALEILSTGNTRFYQDMHLVEGADLFKTVNNDVLVVAGGNATNAGANVVLYGGTHATTPNTGLIRAGGTEVLRWNAAGNIGIGTTDIEAWEASWRALQLGGPSAIMYRSGALDNLWVLNNAYYDGAWKYRGTGAASNYISGMGTHYFQVAPSGTIDTTITWTTAIQIDNTGTCTFRGNNNPIRLEATHPYLSFHLTDGTRTGYIQLYNNAELQLSADGGRGVSIMTNGAARLFVNSAGNIGIGVTPPTWWADHSVIQGAGAALTFGKVGAQVGVMWLTSNAVNNGTSWVYQATGAAALQTLSEGSYTFRVAPSGTSGTAITWTTALEITNSATMYWNSASNKATYLHGDLRYFQLGTNTMLMVPSTTANETTFGTYLSRNAYFGGDTNWYRWRTDYGSTDYYQHNGNHVFRVAAAATGVISWATAFHIHSDGWNYSRSLAPTADGQFNLGSGSMRWYAVYAITGTIQTSARHLKNLQRALSPAEGLAAIRHLPIYAYTRKDDVTELRRFGPVLDEMPEWLRPNDDGESWVVDNLVAINSLAIQAVDDEVTVLRNRVAELERQMAAMSN